MSIAMCATDRTTCDPKTTETMDRQTKITWLRDLLEQMLDHSQHMEWSDSRGAELHLADMLLAQLNQCRRICESIRRDVLLVQSR